VAVLPVVGDVDADLPLPAWLVRMASLLFLIRTS
jgi:hypothetical protein